MSNLFPKRNSLPRKGKHWSQRLRETILDRNPSGHFNLHLVGGAENGEFISLGDIRQDKLKYRRGKLHEGDIFLEINGQPVAGYTAFDVLSLIKASNNSVMLRTVKPGLGITKDLKQFLATRYERDSIDMDLQQTIRDNLYKRTIPCTTRTPRKGEQPGLDYVFLDMEEFERLVKSGSLLESGIYEGNHYGTPKPPPMEMNRRDSFPYSQMKSNHSQPLQENHRRDGDKHSQPVQANHRRDEDDNHSQPFQANHRRDEDDHSQPIQANHRRNDDSIMHSQPLQANHRRDDGNNSQPLQANHMRYGDEDHFRRRSLKDNSDDLRQSLGPLPPNWDIAYSETNEKYFIDHNTGTTQWHDPRLSQVRKSDPDEYQEDELPYGWERIEDPKYGTYYIDHENRKTQFENPVQTHKRNVAQYNSSSYGEPPSLGPPNFQTASALAKAQEAEAMSRWPDVEFTGTDPPAYTVSSDSNRELKMYPYDKYNGSKETQEQDIRTVLYKGSRGFGFTIVGGDQPGELLQIKSIVPDGAASKDGILRTGDALVKVNGMSVLSKTHQDVVGMFQAMPIGEAVELEMIRGYPLPFDPDDPNVETIGSYTVVRAPSLVEPSRLQQTPSEQSLASSTTSSQPPLPHKQGYHKWQDVPGPNESSISQPPSSTFPRTSTAVSIQPQPNLVGERLQAHVVKGGMGFGFTIADSPYGQKVKQILDAPRCTELREGDILVEINGKSVRHSTHSEAVNTLKDCPRGQQALMVIQRGVIPASLKNSPSVIRRDEEEELPVQRAPRPKSTPALSAERVSYDNAEQQLHMGGSMGNLATSGESTKNHDTGSVNRQSQPQVDRSSEALFASYPSLRKAVASAAARRSMENLNGPLQADVSSFTEEGLDIVVHLKRGDMGFGFRIIGGKEESTQVAIGTLVAGGPADLDGRLRRGDEILYIDGISVVGSTHRRVISLMGNAALAGEVSLGIRRRSGRSGRSTPSGSTMRRSASSSSQLSQSALVSPSAREASRSAGNLIHYGSELRDADETSSIRSFRSTPGEVVNRPPVNRDRRRSESDTMSDRRRSEADTSEPTSPVFHSDITLERGENEGFGFVILSSVHKSGSTIGRIIQGSPADRCRQLHVGDRLVAVNGRTIVGMHHSDIVEMIKHSGMQVILKIAQRSSESGEPRRLSHVNMSDINKAAAVNRERQNSDISEKVENNQYREDLIQRSREQFRNQQQDTSQKHGVDNTRGMWKSVEQGQVKENNHYPSDQNLQPKKAPPPVLPKPARNRNRQSQGEPQSEQFDSRPTPPVEPSRPLSHPYVNGGRERSRSGSFQRPKPLGQMQMIELEKGGRGYGFSIRGGKELNMPVLVLRMADDGPAYRDGRLKVRDELVEINGHSTANVLHAEAIDLIRGGGNRVRLLVRRSTEGVPNGVQAVLPQSYSTGSMPRAKPNYHSAIPSRGGSVYSR